MGRGEPTGIRREDLSNPMGFMFKGERWRVVKHTEEADAGGSRDRLVLGSGDRHLELYGYFDGEDFMEVRSRLLD